MSERNEDLALAEYLRGGSEISRRYRGLGGHEVPPELDRRVLGLARKSAASPGREDRPRLQRWIRWSAPVAIAASAVLALSIVLESGVQEETSMNVPQETRALMKERAGPTSSPDAYSAAPDRVASDERVASAPVAPPPKVETEPVNPRFVPAPEPAPSVAEARQEVQTTAVTVEAQRVRDEAQHSVAPISVETDAIVAQPAAEAAGSKAEKEDADLQDVVVTGAARPDSVRRAGPRGSVRMNATRSSEHAEETAQDHETPEGWLNAIRELRRAGRTEEADEEWERFREAHPDYAVAASDPARAKD